MSYHWSDNIHTTAFTPRDYQVELLAAAKENNIIVCLGHNSSKEFIALKLIQELGYQLRKPDSRKVTLYFTTESNGKSAYNLIHYLTDLKAINLNVHDSLIKNDYPHLISNYNVIITNIKDCINCLRTGDFHLSNVNLIVLEDCHKNTYNDEFKEIFKFYEQLTIAERPKVLGLAGPLYNAACPPGRLTSELEYLEGLLKSKAETASDIVTVLRYCTRPIDIIVQCAPPKCCEITKYLKELVLKRREFLLQHRFDLSEIYGGDLLDECQAIPDPKIKPIEFIDNFLLVLNEMGPFCADRAALSLLAQIEKAKVETPYERHYLLLSLVTTTFVQARAFCDKFFEADNEKERIEKYSNPKALRLLEILGLFRPKQEQIAPTPIVEAPKSKVDELDSLNFKSLAQRCETVIQTIQNPTKTTEVTSLVESLKAMRLRCNPPIPCGKDDDQKSVSSSTTTSGGARGRFRRRGNFVKTAKYNHNDPDALCGIVFCESKFMARIINGFVNEASRHFPELDFINVQYTAERVANPVTHMKEAETEHRKQEEVLRRFRMHDCNLLIGTMVLEEGIELPKCNLVIRWNLPKTYRSFGQCKGRARAANAYHILLVAPTPNEDESYEECEKTHKLICTPSPNLNAMIDELEEENQRYESSSNSESDSFTAMEKQKRHIRTQNIDEIRTCVENYKCHYSTNILKAVEFDHSSENQLSLIGTTNELLTKLSVYINMEKLLVDKCSNLEPNVCEIQEADRFTNLIKPFKPSPESDGVNLSNAITLINKYCARLPSDTFTKLTPLWRQTKVIRNGMELFQCSLRLPINSPLRHDIIGVPMQSRILARRIAAFIGCQMLYNYGELDDSLQPVSKEAFKVAESDWDNFELEERDEKIVAQNLEPRPGTTKRRQYYYKRIAKSFSDCRPTADQECYLYYIQMTLECPIPEEQNTRGRKIYPPEEAVQGFGILTTKKIPKISAFPIFTRSGEVRVALSLVKAAIKLTAEQINKINTFLVFTFSNVLRLQKYLMIFDPEATENSFFVVPTVKNEVGIIEVDWKFLDLIANNSLGVPQQVNEEERKKTTFDPNKFSDAVVMPWYRNQDQPQYFYVAEVCYHLSPMSNFPGETYTTFKDYYLKKYNIAIQDDSQPLLDVDHTSARLNFLTPRYVNRKGVALPTSSEETKRAKRFNLEQKQILVPELCTIHPFPASLWRAAVCLPCILYRFNALLLADEIRKKVSHDVGLGMQDIEKDNFEWPVLDFGWSLAEVLKKSRELKQLEVESKIEEVVEIIDEKIVEPIEEDKPEKDKEKGDDEDENIEKTNDGLEIGTWSNDMALGIKSNESDNESATDVAPYHGSPACSQSISDSDGTYQSDDDMDAPYELNDMNKLDDVDGTVHIEYKSGNEAEAIETEEDIRKRLKKQEIINSIKSNEEIYQATKNLGSGFDHYSSINIESLPQNIERQEKSFTQNIKELKSKIRNDGLLTTYDQRCDLTVWKSLNVVAQAIVGKEPTINDLIPYIDTTIMSPTIELQDLIEYNKQYSLRNPNEIFTIEGCGDRFDNFNDWDTVTLTETGTKIVKIDYNKPEKTPVKTNQLQSNELKNSELCQKVGRFSFDYQPELISHPGPSPSIILQALTMSNANDGINLERLETIGDSFLKYAITTYLYCTYDNVHEGKLSHLRSKQVSNLNLYRLGKRKMLGECMIATKFEPHDNWLPPCYYVRRDLEQALIEAKIPVRFWNLIHLSHLKQLEVQQIVDLVKGKAIAAGFLCDGDSDDDVYELNNISTGADGQFFIPYNLVTQHSIPDKSVADCVEALIGAYLIECGPRGALLFMAWLGIRVLPIIEVEVDQKEETINTERDPGSTNIVERDGKKFKTIYGKWKTPDSPLLEYGPDPKGTLEFLLDGYSEFENTIGYQFNDRSYLLQAMTHASYSPNRLTDCYQRLEFLGDAVLDYLITRHLYEDPRQHSPGALTDLRSALVNNTIFASLAVRHDFHKYFRHLSPGLNEVIDRFVRIQHENGHQISEEFYLISEEECDEVEDVEVPKALGDVFESVAGAIFLDSNMSLDAVWRVYSNMMRPEIELFTNSVPKSPIRELLEMEPETTKFSKPEKLADGRRVRVTVEVFGKGTFRGIGRNYRIAKCTAAKCALRFLKKNGSSSKKRN